LSELGLGLAFLSHYSPRRTHVLFDALLFSFIPSLQSINDPIRYKGFDVANHC
jgi:hypothetical protein